MGRTVRIHVMPDKFIPNFKGKTQEKSLFERSRRNMTEYY